MAICPRCNAEMSAEATIDCVAHHLTNFPDGMKLPSIPFTEEPDAGWDEWGQWPFDRCPSCNVKSGHFHHTGCDQEVCPRCHKYVIGRCRCFGSDNSQTAKGGNDKDKALPRSWLSGRHTGRFFQQDACKNVTTQNCMESWQEFMEAVRLRMEKGRQTYGDASFSRTPLELAGEVEEELLDVCGWSFILWSRLRVLVERRPEARYRWICPKCERVSWPGFVRDEDE